MKTLEEVIKNKSLLIFSSSLDFDFFNRGRHNLHTNCIEFNIHIHFKEVYLTISSKELHELLKPFLYYIYSYIINLNSISDYND